jgi:hypothetical protein
MQIISNTRPKVEDIQRWLIRRKNGGLFILMTYYKKSPWTGLLPAIFNSNQTFSYLQINAEDKLGDVLKGKSKIQILSVVFTKWEDSSLVRGKDGAIDYRLVNENIIIESKDIEVIMEI